jgi:group I intron endonuclease
MSTISRTPSIYQIRHIESGRVYVGSAVDPHRRRGKHFQLLQSGTHHARHLQSAWTKYGRDAFVFEIIEPVLFVEDLITREQYWIDTLQSVNPDYGFNASPTAGSQHGLRHTDESRAKMAIASQARGADPAFVAGQSARSKAKWADPSYRVKVVAAQKARYIDPAVRAEVSVQRKKAAADPVYREKRSALSKALWDDPEYRAKQSKARQGLTYPNRAMPLSTPTEKRCPICMQWKPLNEYHKSKSARCGVQSRCKACWKPARKKSG